MEYDDNNKGAIWGAKDRISEKHPHFTGKAKIDGVDYYVSAWKRDPESNPKSPSVKFAFKKVEDSKNQAFEAAGMTQKKAEIVPEYEDDIPF